MPPLLLFTIIQKIIFNIHNFLKYFISQIGIGYLGRVWVPDPSMDVAMGIKNLNPIKI